MLSRLAVIKISIFEKDTQCFQIHPNKVVGPILRASLTHDNTEMVAFVICIRCFLRFASCSVCLWCQQRSEGVYTCRRTDSLADVLQLIVDKDVSDCLTSFRAFDLAVCCHGVDSWPGNNQIT